MVASQCKLNTCSRMNTEYRQGHSIERTTHSMEIAHEILTMYYATFYLSAKPQQSILSPF